MATTLQFVHVTQAMTKELWRAKFLTCPDMCTLDTPQSQCTCECLPSTFAADPYDVLRDSGVFALLNFFDTTGSRFEEIETENGTEFRIAGHDKEFQTEVWKTLLDDLCDVGTIGDMYQASSPNDVTFWVLHPTLDRLWHWIRLSSNHNNFDDTWNEDPSVCYGHNPDDLQPWTEELFGLDGTTPLSNTELYALMSPGTDQMPYVYDNYEWSHCTAMGYDMKYTGTNKEYFVSLYDDTLS